VLCFFLFNRTEGANVKRWVFALCIAIIMLMTGLATGQARTQLDGEITVYAAASLTDAFTEIGAAFEEEYFPDVRVTFNFAGSSTLATQIAEGGPAGVFASANAAQMAVAFESGRMTGEPRTFARNRLTVIVPADNPANIISLRDLANPGVILVLAVPGVPVRDYTDTMLDRMAASAAYGPDYRAAVLANLASEEPDVRQVAARVALGEADAGIVYASDVTPDIAEDVITIPIPGAFNTTASYPIALVDDPAHIEVSQLFIDFVLSDAGQAILERWGLLPVRIPPQPTTVRLPDAGLLSVDGQVLDPLLLDVAALTRDYTAQTVDVRGTTTTGVWLYDLLIAASPNTSVDVADDLLSLYVVVTGHDGEQIALGWGEIDPAITASPALIVAGSDTFTLVLPGDRTDARTVTDVGSISLRDAPPLGE
jgi:molybdate transport system substrate-binding protein